MTRKQGGHSRYNDWDSTTPKVSFDYFDHIPPIKNETAFFADRGQLFTKDGERSWVEFLAAKERNLSSPIDLNVPKEKQMEDAQKEGFEKIKEEGALWDIAKHRGDNTIHTFFIRQKNSNSPLLLTRDLFDALIQSNEVFEPFKEFALSFRRKLQCAYGIRYVELNGHGPTKDPWSVRQTVLYQKYTEGKQTWILISPSKEFQARVETYMQRFSENSHLENPFELHSILISCSLSKWRWYIQSLVERATEQSSKVIAANVDKGNGGAIEIIINFEDRQKLKVVEDRVLELFTIFDSAIDTIQTIFQEYQTTADPVNSRCLDHVAFSLQDSLREVELYRKKVETLHKTVQGTASLLSNLLDNENARVAEDNNRNLAILAQQSREENVVMGKLTEKGTSDAAAVKVITLITILFLPTTVVAVTNHKPPLICNDPTLNRVEDLFDTIRQAIR